MDPTELVTVYSTTNPAEAEVIKNALEAEGIRCLVTNESQAGLSGILDIPILVRAEDLDRARELIESHGESGGLADVEGTS